jgi:hypothetical protein
VDAKQDSIDNWNKLTNAERIALCAYWFDLNKSKPNHGLIDFVTTLQGKASVFDVPEVLFKQ